jgi:hypothetical protein
MKISPSRMSGGWILNDIEGKPMPEDSAKAEGPDPKTAPAQSQGAESHDPIDEMIEVLHSLGILVARGPTISDDEFGDPAEWATGAIEFEAGSP